MAPAYKIFLDRENFAFEILEVAKKGSLGTLTQQEVSEIYGTTDDALKSDIAVYQGSDQLDIPLEAFQLLEEADKRRMSWSTQRKTGLRKAGSSVQKFLNTFSAFLESFSGIVGIVKAAGNQYGGLAYSTLSILLKVGNPTQVKLTD